MATGAEVIRKGITQRLSCVLVETLVCVSSHRGPGIGLVTIPVKGYSRSRNWPEKANQKCQGSSSNNRRAANNHRAFAQSQAPV